MIDRILHSIFLELNVLYTIQVVRGQLSLVNVGVKDPEPQYKFPIETYTGLDIATAERIKKFEAETKAMLTRSAHEHSGSTLQLSSAHQGRLSLDGQTHSKFIYFLL